MNHFYSNLKLFLVAVLACVGVNAWGEEVTDVLNQTVTGITGTSYTEFSGKKVTSDAVYAGQCAGSNSSIQLRSNSNNSGVITTTSGGTAKKVVLVWDENTADARVLQVYGSNTAYTAATDLYNTEKQGTLLGEIARTSTELVIDDEYAYIGFRSKSGALYLTSVSITWETGSAAPAEPSVAKPTLPADASFDESMEVTITAAEGATIYYTIDGTAPTAASSVYKEALTITETTTVKAIAVLGEQTSAVAEATYTKNVAPVAGETADVTLDFTSQEKWNIPTSGTNTAENSFTDGTYTIKLSAATSYRLNSGYLLLGKNGSYLELPAFDFDVEKIEVVGTSGASTAVVQNIYVGDKAVSSETTGAKDVTNTYEIASDYQAAGTKYMLKVTSAHNTQISMIKVYKKFVDPSDTRTATEVVLGSGYATSGEVNTSVALPTVTVSAGEAAVDGAAVTWTSSDETVAKVEEGQIQLLAAGTTTIEATYAGDETYKGSTASYELTVTPAPYTSLKALQENVTATSTPVKVVLTDVYVTAVKDKNAYLADADGYGVLVYTDGHGLEVGQVLNGTITANLVLYKGQTEITDFSKEGLTITTAELTPTEKTIDAISAANQSTLVTLKNVTYTADGNLTDGTNKIKYYDNFGVSTTPEEGKAYNVTGVVILFNTTLELAPRTADDIVELAGEDDYAALNAAIAAHTLGFAAGEYAPYNNIEPLATIAAAKAIDQEAVNTKAAVQAAIDAIANATWAVNKEEMNAVFDGSFEYDYSGQSDNVNPIGWQRVKDAAADGYNVRYMGGTNAGLAATTSGKALFTKNSAFYGYADGYTMPLKADTYYKIAFVYGGWGDCKKDGYVTVLAPDGSSVTLSASDLPLDATNADSNSASWKGYEAIFKTGEAGDYVLGLRKKNESVQSQYVYGDIEIVTAKAEDFKAQLQAELAKANAIDVTANVGTATFQIPASAAEALTDAVAASQTVYDNSEAAVDDVIAALENLQAAETAFAGAELNAPADGQLFNIVNVSEGYNHAGKAVTFKSAADADLTANTTAMGWTELPGSIYPQAVKFTAVEGEKNVYTLSYTRADGNTIYVSTGKTSGLGSAATQIRPTTDAAKALKVRVEASATDGTWYLWNMEAGKRLGANGASDQGFFTGEANGYKFYDMKLQETVKNEVALSIKAADQYGTIIVPFDAELPAGVTAYSVSEVDGTKLTLVEAGALAANTPYIVFAEAGVETTLAGLGAAYTTDKYEATTFTDGLLTGTYTNITATAGQYVLQNQKGKGVAFYLVDAVKPAVKANHAYLTAPAAGGVKAFYLGEVATAIEKVMAGAAAGEIYDLAGRKVSRMVKGNAYIVGGRKVVVK